MAALYAVAVWLHILAVALWLGSMGFLALVLVPVLRRRTDTAGRSVLLADSGRRLRALGWTCFGVLLATGSFSLWVRGFTVADAGGRLWQGPFGHVLALKLTLFLAVLVLSLVHDFRIGPRSTGETDPARAERLRRVASWMGRVTLLLALAIVFCGVLLVRGVP